MKLRLAFKRTLCALGLGSRLIEFCEKCGRETELVWHATASRWANITRHFDGTGVWCMRCFDAECYRRGLRVTWWPMVRARP